MTSLRSASSSYKQTSKSVRARVLAIDFVIRTN